MSYSCSTLSYWFQSKLKLLLLLLFLLLLVGLLLLLFLFQLSLCLVSFSQNVERLPLICSFLECKFIFKVLNLQQFPFILLFLLNKT